MSMHDFGEMMKAFVIPTAENHSVILAEVPIPRVGPNELLVRIHAVGVGIHDSYFLPQEIAYPYAIGIEAAGVVEDVGADVAQFQPGERIAFVSSMQSKGGTWAEFAVVRADAMILRIPAGLTFEEAAAVPVAGNTAVKAFGLLSSVAPGGSLFVAGASGAIGTFALQMARARDWTVAASASARNHDYLTTLGADRAVDYQDPLWVDEVLAWHPGGVDAAIAIQPNTAADSMRVVKDGGIVVTISGDQVAPERGVRVLMPPHDVDVRGDMALLTQQIADGDVELTLEQVFSFDEGLEALAKVQTRHARGKTVLTLR